MFTLDTLFLVTAIGGGAMFGVQLVLQFVGGVADMDVDLDTDVGHGAHTGADLSFKVLSLQGLTAFFMMFGLVGMAMRHDSQAGTTASLLAALTAGVASTWVIGRIFRFFGRLQSTGNLDMQKAVGATATVYLTITRDKPGKVSATVENRLMNLDAITESDTALGTGTSVRIVRVLDGHTVAVERI